MPASGRSRRAWGWHPLTDEWAARIVAGAGVRPGQLVLDIGAGRGELTAHLVAAGARVIAVELHPGRARALRERFADAPVTVVQTDALALRLPERPFHVVASPPYGISSPLLDMLLAPRSRLVAADLVLPRAVVRRYTEGRRADAGRGRWILTAGRPLPRRAFRPPPRVDSAVLVVRRR
ncbi:rRNA adenine N-6-methyltransferase family protein [Thermomonospora cellulosilytica]|uniref:23S rRNA (Adenine-N6)-dimethyltransferase n=1 Tax=Thermomonospora cellulosilytica TaxID=1411118 RepID=A0A7W3R8S1_9ACTN|nr:rRNA adenine N-6-methyltransferase family protein [Thermomonospora cellulosilytica]MBA9003977.1 23S rRNA (adenine-N6)-dimethyltransferase [Thermomonospora cellulosilytica]